MSLFRATAALMVMIGALALVVLGASSAPAQNAPETNAAAQSAGLPKDVHPDSRSRLPLVKRENLDEMGKKAYDNIAGDSRSLVGLQGPNGIRLHSPKLIDGYLAGSLYLRYDTKLGRRLSELAILVTAREMNHQFEWTAHEPAGQKAGLEQNIIDVVKYRKPILGMGEKEASIIQVGRELFQNHHVNSDTFAQALKVFGEEQFVDLVCLMGQYASTSLLLDVFDQQLLEGQKPLLPMP